MPIVACAARPATALPRRVLPRRILLAGGTALALCRPARADEASPRLTSPPGSLSGLQDYPYWIAQKLGYFGGLQVALDPGPPQAAAAVRQVDRGQSDLGAAAACPFALGLQMGMQLVSVWQLDAVDPFALAFRKDEPIRGLKGLAGKTLLLDSAARQPFCDVWFAQAGLEVGSVAYLEAGAGWGQALAQGKGDAALAWEGQRALWRSQGLAFGYLLGRDISRLPGSHVVARARDLADPARRDVLLRVLRGWAMGLAFAERNPRAAAAIAVQSVPGLAGHFPPMAATEAVMQRTAAARPTAARLDAARLDAADKLRGAHDPQRWALLFATMRRIGQITAPLSPAAAIADDLIAAANEFDANQVRYDADRSVLPPDFALVDVDAIGAAP